MHHILDRQKFQVANLEGQEEAPTTEEKDMEYSHFKMASLIVGDKVGEAEGKSATPSEAGTSTNEQESNGGNNNIFSSAVFSPPKSVQDKSVSLERAKSPMEESSFEEDPLQVFDEICIEEKRTIK